MNNFIWSFLIADAAYPRGDGQGQLRTSADFQASAAANPQLEALP
ncbi:MAG TPA: hypothetical protein VLJ58_05175 [Ramlibacter sp.]|nr:hypothetical protein [Ramlibacter sp.]